VADMTLYIGPEPEIIMQSVLYENMSRIILISICQDNTEYWSTY